MGFKEIWQGLVRHLREHAKRGRDAAVDAGGSCCKGCEEVAAALAEVTTLEECMSDAQTQEIMLQEKERIESMSDEFTIEGFNEASEVKAAEPQVPTNSIPKGLTISQHKRGFAVTIDGETFVYPFLGTALKEIKEFFEKK